MPNVSIAYAPWRNSDKGVGQWYLHQSTARFRVLMKGRQSGGTQAAIAEICIDAMAHPGHMNWWVVNNLEVKPRAWRGLLDFLPREVVKKTNETQRRIQLINGSEIWVKSAAGDDSLVSETVNFVVCDECGLWKDDTFDRGISPMLTVKTDPPRRFLLVGTPRGRNWFYKIWQRGRGENRDPDYESFHWKSEDSPFSDLEYLAERKKNMPTDLYKEEFEADPIDSTGGVFVNVRNCVGPADAKDDRFSVIGVDIAQKNDFTAIIPMNSQRQALWVERSQEEYPLQRQRLAGLVLATGARLVMDSASVGLQMVQELRSQGLPVEDVATNSNQAKRALIDNLRIAFQNSTIRIPDDEVLINELESYTYELLPSGMIRYSAPDGGHDDTVIALALALWGQRGALLRPRLGRTNYGHGGETYGQKRPVSTWPL